MVRPSGELAVASYRDFTDGLVKFAIDEPRALIVILDDLRVATETLLTAFSSAWMRVGEWPGVPILLVSYSPQQRNWLQASAVHRFVPVFADLPMAVRAVREPPVRRRTTLKLVSSGDCGQRARAFTSATCVHWGISEIRSVALLVVTELVENAFLHSRIESDILVRLELRDELFTVAVGDADPKEALLCEPGVGPRHYGLHLVAGVARAWGCAPRWPSGKVVWAALPVGARRDRVPG